MGSQLRWLERTPDKREVDGSIPFEPTKTRKQLEAINNFLYLTSNIQFLVKYIEKYIDKYDDLQGKLAYWMLEIRSQRLDN